MAHKTWFITGTSTGLGREWALAALERGDSVAGTARRREPAQRPGRDLRRADAPARARRHGPGRGVRCRGPCARAVRETRRRHQQRRLRTERRGGRGVGATGAGPVRHQLLRCTLGDPGCTALPARAGQRSHHSGLVRRRHHRGSTTQHLQRVEVGARGDERGPRRRGSWLRHLRRRSWSQAVTALRRQPPRTDAIPIAAYQPARERQQQMAAARAGSEGDPRATRAAILAIVDADKPPFRVLLGADLLQYVEATYASRLDTWRQWEPISVAAHDTPIV